MRPGTIAALLMASALLSFLPFVWDLSSPVKIISLVLIVLGLGWAVKTAVS